MKYSNILMIEQTNVRLFSKSAFALPNSWLTPESSKVNVGGW